MKYLACLVLPALLVTRAAAESPPDTPIGPFRSSLKVDRAPLDRNAPMLKSYAGMLDRIQPSVVTIMTGYDIPQRQRRLSRQDDEDLRFFFGLPPAPENPVPESVLPDLWQQQGLGTGVIVTSDGYILTNRHVVLPPDSSRPRQNLKIRVKVPDREDYLEARIIDFSNESDVAVLKVEATGLLRATLADSSQVKVGDVAFALGAPFGIEKTVTMGIISARRNDGVLPGMEKQELLQTDASINPGNSGGPLIDADGRVIGINTAIYSNSGGNMGIGFAIPINNAVAAADALSRPRGFLGVGLASIDRGIASYFRIPGGAIIAEVQENSPASRAGLAYQDIVLSIDGKEVLDDSDLLREIAQRPPGKSIVLTLIRREQKREVSVTLGERPNNFLPGTPAVSAGPVVAGMQLAPLPDADRDSLQPAEGGLVVTRVEPDTPSAKGGLRAGDVIVRINGRRPATAEDAAAAFSASVNGSSMLHVRRGNATRMLTLDP